MNDYVTALTDNAVQTGGAGAGNAGDLRYCITQANKNPRNKIVFQNGLQGTIQLQAALPEIQKNTIIGGPGANLITVQGNARVGNLYSVFKIDLGVIAEINYLSIQGGRNTTGGGIENNGILALDGDIITGNTAGDSGGIYNRFDNLHLSGDVIQNNDATNGGGIYNAESFGSITEDNFFDPTTICCNQATENGGGIFNSGKVNFKGGVTISGNTADMAQDQGGGVYNASNGKFNMGIGNDIDNSNGAFQGGGVYNAGNLTLGFRTTVGGNEANQGGGLYLTATSTTTLSNVTVSGNLLVGNMPIAKGIGYINGATMNLTKLTDDDDPDGKPVRL